MVKVTEEGKTQNNKSTEVDQKHLDFIQFLQISGRGREVKGAAASLYFLKLKNKT